MKTTYYDMLQKIITTKEDIIDIIDYINNISKKNIDMEQLRGGDTFWIQTYDENDYMIDSVMFQGKYLNINGKLFRCNDMG